MKSKYISAIAAFLVTVYCGYLFAASGSITLNGSAPLPANGFGSNGQCLQTDGNATTFWAACGSSGTTASGGLGQVQISDGSGNLTNSAGFSYLSNVLSAADIKISNILSCTNGLKTDGSGNISCQASGPVTSVAGTAPIVSSGGATPTITCNVASGSQPGCLAAADFTTFNGKQAAGNYITALTGDVTASGPGSSAATVVKIQGTAVSATPPTTNQYLQYNGTAWLPVTAASTAAGNFSSVILDTATLAAPGTPSGTPSTSGGTVAAGNHFTRVFAVDANGYLSVLGAQSSAVVTTGATSSIVWTWTASPNAVSYRILVSTVSNSYANYFTSTTNSYTQVANTSGSTAGATTDGPTVVKITTPDIAGGGGTSSQALTIKTGNNNFTTGDLNLLTGTTGGSSTGGSINITAASSSFNGGSVNITAGSGGPSGVVLITSFGTGTFTSANTIVTSNAAGSNVGTGGTTISTGAQSGTSTSGGITIASGTTLTGNSGTQTISSGNASGGATGDIVISTGTVSQNLGAFGQKGKIKIQPGNEGLANLPLGATGTTGQSAWSNSLNLNALVVGQSYLPTPSGTPTGVQAGVNGAMSAGNHFIKVVAVDGFGNKTAAGTESAAVVTSGAASLIRWTWTTVPGADHYEVWVTKVSGSEDTFFATTDNKPQILQTADTGTAGTIPSASTGGYFELDGSTSGNVKIKAAAVTTNHTLTLPAANGAAGTMLTNDGSGGLSWSGSPQGTLCGWYDVVGITLVSSCKGSDPSVSCPTGYTQKTGTAYDFCVAN